MSTNNPLLGESLNDIRSFVAIAETGSFSKAAEKLNASRAHVSRQLSQLEARLGVQLIIRTTRSQRLTSAGEISLSAAAPRCHSWMKPFFLPVMMQMPCAAIFRSIALAASLVKA